MKKLLLYAEDDNDDFELLKTACEAKCPEIELVQVPNGYDVIRFLQQLPAHSYPFLILMDVNMPMLDGRQTLQYLKTDDQYKSIPVVFFTTQVSPADRKLMIQEGLEIIKKPHLYDDWLKIAAELSKYCAILLSLVILQQP